jgi:hypothetical protein
VPKMGGASCTGLVLHAAKASAPSAITRLALRGRLHRDERSSKRAPNASGLTLPRMLKSDTGRFSKLGRNITVMCVERVFEQIGDSLRCA